MINIMIWFKKHVHSIKCGKCYEVSWKAHKYIYIYIYIYIKALKKGSGKLIFWNGTTEKYIQVTWNIKTWF